MLPTKRNFEISKNNNESLVFFCFLDQWLCGLSLKKVLSFLAPSLGGLELKEANLSLQIRLRNICMQFLYVLAIHDI